MCELTKRVLGTVTTLLSPITVLLEMATKTWLLSASELSYRGENVEVFLCTIRVIEFCLWNIVVSASD